MATKSTGTKGSTKKSAAKKPTSTKAAKPASKPKTKVTISKTPSRRQRLWQATGGKLAAAGLYAWNKWLAVIYAVQGAVLLLLGSSNNVPLTTNYLTTDPLKSGEGESVLAGATQQIGSINILWFVAAVLFVAAAAHVLAATVYRRRYEADAKRGIHKVRWIEYSLTTAFMVTTVGLLVGVYDLSGFVMLFALAVIMNLLGLAMEVYNEKARKPNFLAYGVSGLAWIVPWAVFSIYLIGGALSGTTLPGYIYAIFGTIFALFAAFAVVMYLQYRGNGKWGDGVSSERRFMVLSLVTKTALVWQVFAGALY